MFKVQGCRALPSGLVFDICVRTSKRIKVVHLHQVKLSSDPESPGPFDMKSSLL